MLFRSPVLDIGAVAQFHGGVSLAEALVAPLGVDRSVVAVLQFTRIGGFVVNIGSGGQHAAVPGGGGDGSGVHQSHCGNLAVSGLGALPVGKVPGSMTDRQGVVGRRIPRAEG